MTLFHGSNLFYFSFCVAIELGAEACVELTQNYSQIFDKLKAIDGIKPKVLQDFNVIHEKFPCHEYIHDFLLRFVSNTMIYDDEFVFQIGSD